LKKPRKMKIAMDLLLLANLMSHKSIAKLYFWYFSTAC
jgi:hypothetical protein